MSDRAVHYNHACVCQNFCHDSVHGLVCCPDKNTTYFKYFSLSFCSDNQTYEAMLYVNVLSYSFDSVFLLLCIAIFIFPVKIKKGAGIKPAPFMEFVMID